MLALTAIDRELSYIGSNDGDNPMSVNSTSYPPGMVSGLSGAFALCLFKNIKSAVVGSIMGNHAPESRRARKA
ncbi:MAG: hypothetical protein WAM42_18075 [Candidatus Nitrosopolaris sp.]